jgi:subtilase family serine protease
MAGFSYATKQRSLHSQREELAVRAKNHEGKRRRFRLLAIITPIALAAFGLFVVTPTIASAATTPISSVPANWHYACGSKISPGRINCMAIKNTTAHPSAASVRPDAVPSGDGYGPSQLQSAYDLTAASAADGSGTTVALIDAYNDPTAASDLAEYRSAAGLPALTSGQFTVYNQEGETSPLPAEAPTDDDWTLEESLDVDMVSAICPLCKIDLVEADNDSGDGLYIAEQTAATTLGAKYISNSWGGSESSTDTSYDSEYFGQSGVVYTASAGDSAYSGGVIYPATSPNVVSVGGTSLDTSSNSRGWTESVWDTSSTEGTGSGCSAYEPQPSWQSAISLIKSACSFRVDNDVAADADPNTGAAIYDTSNDNGGWNEVGGTSESSPIIASVFALAGNDGNGGNNAADSIYTHTSDLYEVTASSNGSCSPSVLCTATGAADTYNGPTGWGTPDGLTAFESNSTTSSGNTVTVTSPGSQTGTVGTAASLQISATDSASGQTLTYSASGLPTGLSISSSTGLISGTPTTAGTYSVTVTATDTTGASGDATFTWTINSSTGSSCSSTTDIVGNPNFASGSKDWTASSGVIGEWADEGEPPYGSSNYDAWLDGYGEPHTDTLSQTVTEPAGCTGTLDVWLHIDSEQTSGTNGSLTIQAAGSTLATFTNLNANSGYTEYSYSIPAADAGQSIKLLFTGVENNDNNTDYVVGQVELIP